MNPELQSPSTADQIGRFLDAKKLAPPGFAPTITDFVTFPAKKEGKLTETAKIIAPALAIAAIPMVAFTAQHAAEMTSVADFLRVSAPALASSVAIGLTAVTHELAERKSVIFQKKKFPAMTYGLMLLNGLGFLASQQQDILNATVLNGNMLGHEPLRLLTSIFMHKDPSHFLTNMGVLYLIGRRVEEKYGSLRTFATYLASGLTGNLLHAATLPHIPAMGSSGANMGLIGELTAYAGRAKNSKLLKAAGTAAALFTLPLSASSSALGHAGGLVSGIASGLRQKINEPKLVLKKRRNLRIRRLHQANLTNSA